MKAVSRTIMARSLVVLATTAGVFLAGSSMAQTNAPAPAAQTTPAAGPQGGPPAGGPGMGHGKHQGMHHRMHGGHRGEFMGRMDTDKDGAVSRAEFDAAGQKMAEMRNKMFEQADANKDGKLTREEMKAFHKSRRGEHRGPRGPHREGDMKGHQHGQPAAPAAPAPKQ